MGERNLRNIFITGFSYTGKTCVSQVVAGRLGWDLLDVDEEIVRLANKPIPEIFTQDGEEHFRKLERQALKNASQRRETVIATGGGIVVAAENREIMKNSGVVICLEAEPETIYKRLVIDSAGSEDEAVRPLLAVSDPMARIISLKDSRQGYYAQSDWTVHTDKLSLDEVSGEVVRGWNYVTRDKTYSAHDQDTACVVTTATESYPVFVGWGLLGILGQRMKKVGLSGKAYLISDDSVFPLYGNRAVESLLDGGFLVDSFTVPQGEKSKSIEIATQIYDFLVQHRAERGQAIVALGGGVVGDLAGFVAATFLRGMPLVQVPTSLVAMVDSSIGGKVAINHPQGKNLIGAFYQPNLVIADVETLTTLSKRELTSGWAEVIKHGLIRDAGYFNFLEQNADKLIVLDNEPLIEAIKRSAAIKAMVVSEDEKESGLRTILNYGHTIAHGLETATGYEHMLHGEAVSVGMMGAARIAGDIGLLDDEDIRRQRALLQKFGLPTVYPGVDPETIQKAMELDKKVREKAVRWVLLERIGEAVIRKDVSPDMVRLAICELVQND